MPCAHSWAWGFLSPQFLGDCLIFSIPQICAGLLKFQETPDLGAVHQRIFAPQFRGGYQRFVRQATSLGISGLWVRYRTAQICALQNWIVAISCDIKREVKFDTGGAGNFQQGCRLSLSPYSPFRVSSVPSRGWVVSLPSCNSGGVCGVVMA